MDFFECKVWMLHFDISFWSCHCNGSFVINLGRPNVDGSEEDLYLWLVLIPNLIPPKRGPLLRVSVNVAF